MGIFGKLKESLAKVGGGMLAGVFAGPERIDEDFYEELEEALIVADVGMETTEILLARLRQAVKEQELHTRSEARQAMVEILAKAMEPKTPFAGEAGPAVLLIVGVNGVGKTTSLGSWPICINPRVAIPCWLPETPSGRRRRNSYPSGQNGRTPPL